MPEDALPDEPATPEDIEEYEEQVEEELLADGDDMSPAAIAREAGVHIPVADHVERDEKDVCGYCGQAFGPDDIVVERRVYGRLWRFCDETCMREFLEESDFKDEDLDSDADPQAQPGDDEEEE